MRRKGGEGGYERRRFTRERDYHSTGEFYFGGFSWIWTEESLSFVVGKD
jgi:hypothetical protein